MSDCPGLPNKNEVARALLLKGTVFVHLDPRVKGALVPAWLRDRPQLVLQIGLDMPLPIPDLRLDDAGLHGTLSFNRAAFTCSVPWDAVFALVGDDGKGMVWPASMPAEIAAEVEREARRARLAEIEAGAIEEVQQAQRPRRRRRAASHEPKGSPAAAAARSPRAAGRTPPSLELIAGDGSGSGAPSSERRASASHLRLVK